MNRNTTNALVSLPDTEELHLPGVSSIIETAPTHVIEIAPYQTAYNPATYKQNIHHHHYHWLDSPTWALAFLRRFCQLKYPAIASSDFVTRVFSRVGLPAPSPTPGYLGGPMFSVRVVSLSSLVSILKRQDLAFCPCMT
jgi:hypothetical protein